MAIFPVSRGKNRISQGVENRGSLITQRAQRSKNSRFRARLKISIEIEHFERATHRGLFFCGEIETSRLKFSSEIENFDRDRKFRAGLNFFDRWALWVVCLRPSGTILPPHTGVSRALSGSEKESSGVSGNPRFPKECTPESQKSPKRVRKSDFRLLRGLLGTGPPDALLSPGLVIGLHGYRPHSPKQLKYAKSSQKVGLEHLGLTSSKVAKK